MASTFCVFGEGPNDIGEIKWPGDEVSQEGCYSGFLKTASGLHGLKCVKARAFKNLKMPGPARKRPLGHRLSGFRRHAYYSAMMASTDGVDIMVIGTDVDRGRGSGSNASARNMALKKYREEFEEGYRIACEMNEKVGKIILIVIVPLCKLEAWLLSDEEAYSKVVCFSRGELPKNPEELFGQTDAKKFLDGLFMEKYKHPPNTKILFDLAVNSSPDVLKQKCPRSYPPFYKQCEAARLLVLKNKK